MHSSPDHSSSDLGVSPDFDLDPMPANGAQDGTWNPGMLLARASAGGAAFVLSLLDALEAEALRHKKAPRMRSLKHGVVEKELMVCHRGLEPRTSKHGPRQVGFCYSRVLGLALIEQVSDQSLMCNMLLRALQCEKAVAPTYLEHARLAADRALLHVPLRRRATGHLEPPGAAAHCEPARFKVGTGLALSSSRNPDPSPSPSRSPNPNPKPSPGPNPPPDH